MVHFDAHSDTNDRYFGDNKYTHGTPFRRAIEEGLLDPKRTVQIGIRGSIYSADDKDWARERRHPHHRYRGVLRARRRRRSSPRRAASSATARPMSASTSTALDPVYAPGTGTPEIGGFSTPRRSK